METQNQSIQVTNVKQHECFLIIQVENKFKIAIADNIISAKEFKTEDEAVKYINKKPWELIFNGALLLTEKVKEIKK